MPHDSLLESFVAVEAPARRAGRRARLQAALQQVEQLYGDRLHWTGVTLVEHVLGVLEILRPFQPDDDTVIACFLQHVLRAKLLTVSDIEEQWGQPVARIVSGVHLLSHINLRGFRHSIEDLRLMLLSVSEDVRVILLLLCKRCFAVEHSAHIPPAERRRLCRESLDLFAPVAARLGIHTLKQKLESLAFPLVYPHDAELIAQQREDLHRRYGSFLFDTATLLKAELKQHSIDATVEGREKQLYSIFLKMKAKGLTHIDKLPDLFALRVIVANEEECYRVLGILHRMARPGLSRFKDYIAFPKPNGYRSLHTTLTRLLNVPQGLSVEVQVRTSDMHREAEYGIAAHWSYKEGGTAMHALQRAHLQQLLTSQQAVHEGKRMVFADHICVLTPKGDIIELPEGARPLDFAFQIHTHLGLAFRAARVNGHIVPLDYELENGDVIEILTHRVPKPSPEWLQLLKMASSRSRLKRYLYTLHRDRYVADGRDRLNEALEARRLPLLDVDYSFLTTYAGRPLTFTEREDLLLKIGQGSVRAAAVIQDIQGTDATSLTSRRAVKHPRTAATQLPVEVDGGLRVPLRFAKCCKVQESAHPVITGVVTRTGEVVIHRKDCRMLRHANPARRVGVRWNLQQARV